VALAAGGVSPRKVASPRGKGVLHEVQTDEEELFVA